jgi:hypothetical protein
MTQIQPPYSNLFEVIRAATELDRVEDAGYLVQQFLAGPDSSEIDRRLADFASDWSDANVNERHGLLVAYAISALECMPQPEVAEELALPGFKVQHTGGGCVVLAKQLPDGSQWLVTSEDGSEIPRVGDDIGVTHCGGNGEILFEHIYSWPDFSQEDLLTKVQECARKLSPPVYDRDAMIDEDERRAFVEEQDEADEDAFEAFRATRKQMSGLEYADLIGDRSWEDDPERQLLVYDDRWNIEITDDGRYMLTLENHGWITGPDTTLEDIERVLFDYSKHA